MKNTLILSVVVVAIFFSGCEWFVDTVQETPTDYRIEKDKKLTVVLQEPLSSNSNKRGDSFISKLKEPIIFKEKTILPKNTQIRGLVKKALKFEKLGDRANLLLLFDQLVLPNGEKIPLAASLDTDKGSKGIKIKGKTVKNATIIGGSALMGSLAGRTRSEKSAKQGLIIGAVAGTSVVLLSNAREVKLPVGTELTIKLDKSLIIPK
jgi:hypothetical protein